jgi:hypothetical protein
MLAEQVDYVVGVNTHRDQHTLAALAGAGPAAPRAEKTGRPIQVLTALRHAGLPVGRVRCYTASSDPNKLLGRPGQYTGKANFKDRRIRSAGFDVDNGGSVETFASKSDAKRRFDYVSAITKSSPLFAEYDYLEGTVFLRVSHELTPRQAKAYERALRRAV